MTLTCFQRALTIAEDETLAEVGCLACYLLLIYQSQVWYNVGHLSLGIGDVNLAYQCFRLALTANNDHAESYNNIGNVSHLHTQHHYMHIFTGVLEMRKGHVDQARAFFQTAASLAPHMFECHYNYSTLSEKTGDLQTSYVLVQKSITNFPQHADSKDLLLQLGKHFQQL